MRDAENLLKAVVAIWVLWAIYMQHLASRQGASADEWGL